MGSQLTIFNDAVRKSHPSQAVTDLTAMFKLQERLVKALAKAGKGGGLLPYAYQVGNPDAIVDLAADRHMVTKDQFLAIIAEAVEGIDWTRWKSWKTYPQQPNWFSEFQTRAEVMIEVIDIQHFLYNIAIAWGVDPHLYGALFFEKHLENMRRVAEGY